MYKPWFPFKLLQATGIFYATWCTCPDCIVEDLDLIILLLLHFESSLHHLEWLLPSTSKNVLLIKMSKLALRDKQWILGINVLCGYHTTPKLHFIGVCTVFHRFLKNQEMWYLLRTLSLSRSNKEEILLTEDKISLELLGEKWKKSSWWATSMKIFRQIFIMLRNYAKTLWENSDAVY